MSETVDIKRVLSGSVSEVPIEALTRKGFKQVKVLNQAMVMRLIAEAVEEVWSRRSHEISEQERRKVIEESKARFEELARQRLQDERTRLDEVELQNRALASELETQRNRAASAVQVQAERDQATARVAELENQLVAAQQQLDSANRAGERSRVDLENARSELSRLSDNAARLTGSQAERDQAVAKVAELERELANYRDKLTRADQDLARKADDVASARADLATRNAEVERLSSAASETSALRNAVGERDRRIAELEGVLSAKDAQLAAAAAQQRGPSPEELLDLLSERLQAMQQPSGDIRGLQDALAGISEKISKLRLAGGSDPMVNEKDASSMVAFLEKTAGRESLESNVSSVNVRQKKTGAVKGALDKLKRMQQQGGGNDG